MVEDGLTPIQNLLGEWSSIGNDISKEIRKGTLSKDELMQIAAGYLESERAKIASTYGPGTGLVSSPHYSIAFQLMREESERLGKMTQGELNSWVKENLGLDFSKWTKTEQVFAMKAYAERGDNQYEYGNEKTYIRAKTDKEISKKAAGFNEDSFWKEQVEYAKLANNRREEGKYVKISSIENEKKKAFNKFGIEIKRETNSEYAQEIEKANRANREVFKKIIEDSWKNMNLADNTTSQYYAGQSLFYQTGNHPYLFNKFYGKRSWRRK